jgi:hypothetical protein
MLLLVCWSLRSFRVRTLGEESRAKVELQVEINPPRDLNSQGR